MDGLTVVAGINGVGKSTLLKIIYSVLTPHVNFADKVRDDIGEYAIRREFGTSSLNYLPSAIASAATHAGLHCAQVSE